MNDMKVAWLVSLEWEGTNPKNCACVEHAYVSLQLLPKLLKVRNNW